MTETMHEVAGEPTTVFERAAGVVELRTIHERDTAVVVAESTPGGLKDAIGQGLGDISEAGREAGVGWAGPPFVRYLEWAPGRVVAEIGVPSLRPMPAVGRVGPGRLPGGRVASIVHVGPYEAIEGTYETLTRRIGELALQPAGPMWEIYWSDPEAEPDPATWRTEILQPVV